MAYFHHEMRFLLLANVAFFLLCCIHKAQWTTIVVSPVIALVTLVSNLCLLVMLFCQTLTRDFLSFSNERVTFSFVLI